MQIRVTKVKQNGKTYEYAQLVDSFRRKSDGMPMHKVIANLGKRSPLEIANLKMAVAASRNDEKVIVSPDIVASERNPVKPLANLRYLNVAVLLQLWRQWKLDEIFEDLIPTGDCVVPPWAVVATLAIQRCVHPESKAYAEQWFPKTALPELLGISPSNFNNTRIHRVLESVDRNSKELQGKLPRLYAKNNGAFAALFLDVTDTWFVGHGPEVAESAKTKEGVIRRKIGIVLLCNDEGYPLRWEVIRGRQSDSESMTEMVRSISGLSWLGETPIVVDRAMGNTAQIRDLISSKVRFLTALTRKEFDSYTNEIPYQPLKDFFPPPGDDVKHIARAAKLVEAEGMTKLDDNLFVLDLGLIERPGLDEEQADHQTLLEEEQTVLAMRLGRQIREAEANGKGSQAFIGRALGLKKTVTFKYRKLADLPEDIQRDVLDGKAQGVAIAGLLRLRKLPSVEEQVIEFRQLVHKATGPKRVKSSTPRKLDNANQEYEAVRLRAIVYFNPEIFIDKRRRVKKQLAEIDRIISRLNKRLASPHSRMTEPKILAEVDRILRKQNLIELYQVNVEQKESEGRNRYFVRLTLDYDEWARRRRYDGFSLLVSHPQETRSAGELSQLYRAKDRVEKDFQIIKSFVRLRPIRHRIEEKVRAHVTICMLSLLLERTLDIKLGKKISAKSALDTLEECRLNRYPSIQNLYPYQTNTLDEAQDAILRKINMRILADDEEIIDKITPR